ncbi:DUF3805 domain-containing protein [Chryseobacterium sp. POL2]|uniref:DUF3805 domain-containing protein n=1 Tax=Chryseobacterium sp. POL2 TaxID=2713414 RepID=UPI0013E17B27|nr:DUF3805 domain-containing protein [Chryseobacterium sp. POL2]QIG88553.1 DUF3805 domain-containing protein [Chryseobacterium sp. POL2]
MKIVQILSILILLIFNNCSKKMENNFNSEYNYSLKLPENWNEYETEEKSTNAFFDTIKWTGNLRITLMNYNIDNPDNFLNKILIEKEGENINWKNIRGIYYVETKNNEEMNYWYLIENNKFFICSFLVGNLKGKKEIENELIKVENTLKTLKTK